MKILYVGLLYNYGKPEEGFSYEHMNIEAGLHAYAKQKTLEVVSSHPDDMKLHVEQLFNSEQFDAIFHVAFNESLDLPENVALDALKKGIPVIQWDCDSSWRFGSWILPRKNRVSHFVTTHSGTIPWYRQNGMKVIKSQWGGSPLYKPSGEAAKYDVSFIGQKHGLMPDGRFLRSEIINAMMAAGLQVDLFGNYWDGYERWHGYAKDFETIIAVFNQTKINLNLSNPWHHGTMPQIKGRHFEIPQCQGFQLATPADDLLSYFVEDKEIVIARSLPELITKAKYYLAHEDERNMIAKAGRERMLAEHQWSHRFDHIFREVGLCV